MVKNIKQEISETGGICAAPLNVTDVSLECVRHLIPASLYLLLSLMITSDITDKTDEREGLQSRPHKFLMEAFFRLLRQAFLNWCQSSGQDVVSRQRDELSQKIKECIAAVVKKEGVSTSMRQRSQDFTKVTDAFERCKATRPTV